MVVVIHQPHFFPWLGYFNKLSNADCLVFQDDVQFRRRYFQNRTKIRNVQDNEHWLTIPVHANRSTLIKDVYTADDKWKNKIVKNLVYSYSKFPHFKDCWCEVEKTILHCRNRLIDINQLTLNLVLTLLDISIDIELSSTFRIDATPTEKLVAICETLGADGYLFGEGGGMAYHGTSMFKKHGIKTYQQDFLSTFSPISVKYYPDCINLSVLDYIFILGIKKTRDIVFNCWRLEK